MSKFFSDAPFLSLDFYVFKSYPKFGIKNRKCPKNAFLSSIMGSVLLQSLHTFSFWFLWTLPLLEQIWYWVCLFIWVDVSLDTVYWERDCSRSRRCSFSDFFFKIWIITDIKKRGWYHLFVSKNHTIFQNYWGIALKSGLLCTMDLLKVFGGEIHFWEHLEPWFLHKAGSHWKFGFYISNHFWELQNLAWFPFFIPHVVQFDNMGERKKKKTH